MIDFNEKISLLSNKELLDVIKSKDDYQEEFWELALADAEKRGLKNRTDKIVEKLHVVKAGIKEQEYMVSQKEADLPELYSDKAIVLFTLFFSTIAGSLLFSRNLKALGIKGRDTVISFGVLYFIGTLILAIILPNDGLKGLGTLINLTGGFIIIVYFGNKYYPKKLNFNRKKIWKALLISISISLAITGLIIIAFSHGH